MSESDLWLTRLQLTADGQRLDRREWHVTIACHAETARLLWVMPRDDLLLVQSSTPLTARMLPGLVSDAQHVKVQTLWADGTRMSLSLIANPTVCRDGNKLFLASGQEDWFRRQLNSCVELNQVDSQSLGVTTLQKPSGNVTFGLAVFHATGTVTDSALLADKIHHGIGREKAYGAGLLLVGGLE